LTARALIYPLFLSISLLYIDTSDMAVHMKKMPGQLTVVIKLGNMLSV
jgi:hypothetical protein